MLDVQVIPGSKAPSPLRVMASAELLVIAAAAILVVLFALASAFAPKLRAALDAERIDADSGYAYTFYPNVTLPWPYVVPSHPDAVLAPGDITLLEDGRPLGPPKPSHEEIRRLGKGRFDLWERGLWFSTSDDTDPRHNGRHYLLLVKTRVNGFVNALDLACWVVLAVAILSKVLRHLRVDLIRRFPEVFVVVNLSLLGALAVLTALHDMPVLYTADSFNYVYPGLLLVAGKQSAGMSVRDLGYPSLAAAAVELGSLGLIPRLQLGMVVAGLLAVLAVLLVYLRSILQTLAEIGPRHASLAVPPLTALGGGYCVLLFAHDGFVLNIYMVMAEAPHFLPTALAFMFFVLGWMSPSPRNRILCLAAATCAAYVSSLFKPHTLLVFALSAASLVLALAIHRRSLRSRAVLGASAHTLGLIRQVHHLDVWVTPTDDDFGPKTLFCNHLDAVLPGIGTATAERAALSRLLENVLAQGPHGWPTIGYDGDLCFYSQPVADAIEATRKAEGVGPAAWLDREFVKGVLSHPLRYARDVFRQLAYFFEHPIVDIDGTATGGMPDGDWARLQPFSNLINMPRDQFGVEARNWFTPAFPKLAQVAKMSLRGISDWFAPVVGLGTILALGRACSTKRGRDLAPERALLAVASFTVAFALTTALSHTFDVSRYVVSILPFSLAWWAMGGVYLLGAATLVGARMLRPLRRAAGERGVLAERP